MELTKKEKRLAELLATTTGDTVNIGYICRTLKTTPRTLINETLPGLRKKLEDYRSKKAYDVLAAGEVTIAESGLVYGSST